MPLAFLNIGYRCGQVRILDDGLHSGRFLRTTAGRRGGFRGAGAFPVSAGKRDVTAGQPFSAARPCCLLEETHHLSRLCAAALGFSIFLKTTCYATSPIGNYVASVYVRYLDIGLAGRKHLYFSYSV